MTELRDPIEPPSGAHVDSADGRNIGRLGEIVGDYFQLFDMDGREYWFARSQISEWNDQRLRVSFRAGEMSSLAVPSPGAREESQYLDEDVTPDEERQRELMLRELSEQRREMHQEDETTPEADDTVGEPVERELSRMTGEDVPEPDEQRRAAG